MPCEAGAEGIAVGGVVRHDEVIYTFSIKEITEVLVLEEEPQPDGAHVEAGVGAHPGVVSDPFGLLGSEHACFGAEDG